MNELSNKTAEAFANGIKHITEDKTVFLSILFILNDQDDEPIDSDDEIIDSNEWLNKVEFVKKMYTDMVRELRLNNTLEFDIVLQWFKEEKIINIQNNYIQFSHPSYAIALDYLLIQDDFKQTFSKILLKLFEKDEAIAQITMIITANFDKLPDDIRNLLFKLYERAIGYSALNIDTEITVPTSRENADDFALKLSASNAAVLAAAIANNYNELTENIRSLLFKLFKNDWMAANFIMSIATGHKDKLCDDMMNFLVKLSEKDEALGQVADAIRHNFDKIPEDIKIKILLKLSEKEDFAWEIAHIVGDNLDKLPEDIKTKLLFKLSERNNAFGAVAMIVEKNFDKFPEDIKTKLLFKLSEAKNVTGAIALIIEKNFDKLSEDARNLLLLKFSEKEIFHNYITNIIAKNFDKFSDDVIQKMLEKMQKTLQEIIGIIYIKKYYLSKEKESRLISMYTAKAKVVNLDGDYYYCKLCDTWHRYRCDAASLGNKHIAHIDEEKMNIQIAKYYFCGFCNKWHTDAKKENEKLNIYKNIVYYESENEHLCKCIAETKYHLGKYIEAIEYWEKAIYISENFSKKMNVSETEIKHLNQNIEKNVFRTYRKLISLYKKQGKNDCVENTIQQFLNKYPNQSDEVLPKQRSQKYKEESFLINSINNSVSLKLIKKIKIKSKAQDCIVKFIDNQLLYRFGTQEAYTLIKISNTTDTDWDTHYEMEVIAQYYVGFIEAF